MKLTAQEEYGLRCLLQIAREPAGFSTIHEIASREGLTSSYVAKLLRLMRKAGFVTSLRGRKGGFRLSQSAGTIPVSTVLGILGGRLYSATFCRSYKGHKRTCVHDMDCSIRSLWAAIDSLVEDTMSKVMLADLFCTERQMRTWCRGNLQGLSVSAVMPLSMGCPAHQHLTS
jgi:Rrf2 family protein